MSLLAGDLTTLATLKGYMTSYPGDPVASGLITRISRAILSELNRPLLVPRIYNEQFTGYGTRRLVLPNWPVLSITSLLIGNQNVPVATQPTLGAGGTISAGTCYGFRFEPWSGLPPGDPAVLTLGGASYYVGNQNVQVSYLAGYQVTGEVPNAATYTPLAPYGIWATDRGATYLATGVALTAVAGPAPSVGQYVPPAPDKGTSPTLNYIFNAADIVTGISINYGFIPADVEQAALELIQLRTAIRIRPGIRSQSLASQESMSFDNSSTSDFVKATLGQYISVIPPATGAQV